MKNTFKFVAVLGLLLAAAVIPAAAQSKRMLTLRTSFGFTVENQGVPAGDYRIQLHDGWLQIQAANGKSVVSSLTFPASAKSSAGNARVVFHQYGNRYYLSEVWLAASERGRQTLESRQERQSRKVESPKAVVVQLTQSKEGR